MISPDYNCRAIHGLSTKQRSVMGGILDLSLEERLKRVKLARRSANLPKNKTLDRIALYQDLTLKGVYTTQEKLQEALDTSPLHDFEDACEDLFKLYGIY